jgi:hypothetical protein
LINVKKITELLLNLERDKNLFEIRIEKVFVWNFLRHEILQDLYNDLLSYNIKTVKNSKSNNFLFVIKNLFKTIKQYLFPLISFNPIKIKQFDYAVFNYGKYSKINGKLFNEHSLPLAEILKKKYKIAVFDKSGLSKKLNHYPCQVIDIRPLFIKSNFLSLLTLSSKAEKKVISMIHDHIFSTFNYKINKKKYLRLLRFRLIYFKKWNRIFSFTNLKGIFYCNDGTMEEVIKAAQLNEIKSIELQHSIISNLNIFYNYNTSSENIYLNDYLITWGDAWKAACFSKINTLPLGSLSKFAFGDKVTTVQKNNKKILIVGSIKGRNQLSDISLKLSKKLNDYHIYYKLRPEEVSDWKLLFPSNFKPSKNLTIIDSLDNKIDYYIKSCDYVIGIETTVLFEAIFYNTTPIFLIDKHGWYLEYSIFHQKNIGAIVKDDKDVIKYINSSSDKHIDYREKISDYVNEFDEDSLFQFLKKI